ncbi:hypothetical protein P167DRAFT_73252 [Morchella conica CCBAS932]|uniref:Uncharacterized protein n=1 Tax=Morchella conica CCBAS932 TaxID=1392247 RepID=A0A3N4KX68_9PEZI|nr:hypothetical protein P167DRAFT_73252 [Morchella conica CCBAS932]
MSRWPKPGPDDDSKPESSNDLGSKQGAALELQTAYNSNTYSRGGGGGGGGGGYSNDGEPFFDLTLV